LSVAASLEKSLHSKKLATSDLEKYGHTFKIRYAKRFDNSALETTDLRSTLLFAFE
jgi:hypothetical protein